MKKALAAIAALTFVLVVAGCGGGNDTTTTGATGASGASGATGVSGAALSKTEFIAQADAICKKGNQAINKAGKDQFPKGSKATASEHQAFDTDTAIPNIQTQVDGVDALTPPAGDEAKVQAIVDAANAALDKVKADPSLFTNNKADPFAETNKLAKDYGLKVCGS